MQIGIKTKHIQMSLQHCTSTSVLHRSCHFSLQATFSYDTLTFKGRASTVLPAMDGYCPARPGAGALSQVAAAYKRSKWGQ